MSDKEFSDKIDRARTMLQQHYRSVTVSASYALKLSIFISVKTYEWEQDMEYRPEDAPDTPLSEWIYNEVRAIHAPDINLDAHNRHYARWSQLIS